MAQVTLVARKQLQTSSVDITNLIVDGNAVSDRTIGWDDGGVRAVPLAEMWS